MSEARVLDLAIQERPEKTMATKKELFITYLGGPYGDHRGTRNQNGGTSQVLVISLDQLKQIWGERSSQTWLDGPIEKGNILVGGVSFNEAYTLKILKELHIGDALLEVTGLLRSAENRVCGASCRVRQSGFVKIGDPVF